MIEFFIILVLILTTVFFRLLLISMPLRTELPAKLLVLLAKLHHLSAISKGGR